MKRILLPILVTCFTWLSTQAQNEPVNPFEEFGYTPKIATLSKGKYVEFHDQDSIVQISHGLFNVNTMKLVGFVQYDTAYSEATLEPEVISRWLSPDPLSSEFPSWSPYNYVENSPIILIDPTGLAPTVFADEGGNVLVDVKDGNDDVYIVKDENRKEFSKEILNLVKNPEQASPEKSKKIGESYGFHIDKTIEGFGFSAFNDKTLNSIDFQKGFFLGYKNEGILGFLNLGGGKGEGGAGLGYARGKKFKEDGKLNPFQPKIKGNPLIIIKTNENNTESQEVTPNEL